MQNSYFAVDIEGRTGEICAGKQIKFAARRKDDLGRIPGKLFLIVSVMFPGTVARPAKPQVTALALENFDDELFSPDKFYDAGGTAVRANTRLALPSMVENAPDVANLCLDIYGILF